MNCNLMEPKQVTPYDDMRVMLLQGCLSHQRLKSCTNMNTKGKHDYNYFKVSNAF